MCSAKNQKLEGEAQFGQVTYAFEATHSDSRAKIVTFFLMTHLWKSLKIHWNFPSKWIMRSSTKQASCKLPSKWLRKNTYKTSAILHNCSKCEEKYVFRTQWSLIKMSTSLFGSPRAPVEGTFHWDGRNHHCGCRILLCYSILRA